MIGRAVRFAASGILSNGPCVFFGFLWGVDNVTDTTISFYNGITPESGTEIFPSTTFDASTMDPKGFMSGNFEIECPEGLYVQVASPGGGEGVAYFRPT